MRIVLASASPRRRELLSQIGLEFEVIVSDADEKISGVTPTQLVEELSALKAKTVLNSLEREEEAVLVIGADTVVEAGGRILGKPTSTEHAAKMLQELSGSTHRVFTGVTFVYRNPDGSVKSKTFHEKTEVTFYPMTEEEIQCYVSTLDCMDKAGAYGIQGFCARYIQKINGDYNNVVGLPVGRLYQEAKEFLI
ncbi:MAG: Maf family protein [Acetatifactor sp.]